jgi:hypothetical protein
MRSKEIRYPRASPSSRERRGTSRRSRSAIRFGNCDGSDDGSRRLPRPVVIALGLIRLDEDLHPDSKPVCVVISLRCAPASEHVNTRWTH